MVAEGRVSQSLGDSPLLALHTSPWGYRGRLCLLFVAAMEPSGSLFPSLVVVGHIVTLAAVWHWRSGRQRQRVQNKQGKSPCFGHGTVALSTVGASAEDCGGAGQGGGSAFLPPLIFPVPSSSCR